jgi:hypothetical protein
MKAILVILAMLLLAVGAAFAEVSDFECLPHAPGFYMQGYPAYFSASKTYDADGNSQDLAETWSGFGFALRPAYTGVLNNHRWNVSAVLPYQSWSAGPGTSQSGIGDMQFSAAYWLWDNHGKGHNLSVWFWADVPTGDDAKGLGAGQMNLRPGVAYGWDKYPYQMQTSAFYNVRMENSETTVKPGSELWANWSLGYSFQPNFMVGAELESGWGMQDDKWNDVTAPDTKASWFKVGPSVQYQMMPNLGFKVKGLYNAFGKNSARSLDLAARFEWTFNR